MVTSISEHRIPSPNYFDDYRIKNIPVIEIIEKVFYGNTVYDAKIDILDLTKDQIIEVFKDELVTPFHVAILEYIDQINPRGVDKYINEKYTKEKLLLFFETIVENIPDDAMLDSLDERYYSENDGILYYHNFINFTFSKFSRTWKEIFKRIKIKSQQSIKYLLNEDRIKFFKNQSNYYNFEGTKKELAYIAYNIKHNYQCKDKVFLELITKNIRSNHNPIIYQTFKNYFQEAKNINNIKDEVKNLKEKSESLILLLKNLKFNLILNIN